jgi:hypothetical protein
MAGTQNLVRSPKGTGQELDGMLVKFLEPPTALAAVPHPSTSPMRKMLTQL